MKNLSNAVRATAGIDVQSDVEIGLSGQKEKDLR